ncbi:unnamed protein product [Zymoseptoria tritici ST99CH_3D1]|nr:unnamed protein product [Zymoseptoria tritici ST99CH_3D1]
MSYPGRPSSSDGSPDSRFQDDTSHYRRGTAAILRAESSFDSDQDESLVIELHQGRQRSKYNTKDGLSLFPPPPPNALVEPPVERPTDPEPLRHQPYHNLGRRSSRIRLDLSMDEAPASERDSVATERGDAKSVPRMRSDGDLIERSPIKTSSHFQAIRDLPTPPAEPQPFPSSESSIRHRHRTNTAPSSERSHHTTQADSVDGHSAVSGPSGGPVAHVSQFPPRTQNLRSELVSRQVDMFSATTFEQVLNDPTTNYQLLQFSRTRLCGEDVEFLGRAEEYHRMLNSLTKLLADIDNDFLSPRSQTPISLSEAALDATHRRVKHVVKKTTPVMELVLREAQQRMRETVFAELYPRFVRHQLTVSASRALANDRSKFQGLGDCFCLTDPRKADNPIVFASDGFVSVTGYSRSQIVPRNCRFLQGQDTDREAVARLRECIRTGQESVELLLNYKENGEPFWNLLYCAPLFSPSGEIDFFLGGQINCSTTIHTNADVMRVLSTSASPPPTTALPPLPTPTPSSAPSIKKMSRFRQAFRPFTQSTSANRCASSAGNAPAFPLVEAGAEAALLRTFPALPLATQMQQFRSTYAHNLVIHYRSDPATLPIAYASAGLISSINPSAPANAPRIGMDVFKFIKDNLLAPAQMPAFKDRVLAALREGRAVSVKVGLKTRRSVVGRGEEGFVSHWTPVKDERSQIGYVVVCLAGEFD